ncbi:hypothetical protein [Brevibacillus dissolubilis]|uniref:hypothetical protein n=1 Tax=Brevibacillus dissolubilis TaxID=1844116 RepID=UPI00111622F3|nr:hypothetical protein [Brevibacillus dissolubilis]
MHRDLQRFVTTFRDLEQKDHVPNEEERQHFLQLKEKLATTMLQEKADTVLIQRVIAVASFYPQAGATFLASNYACAQSQLGLHVTLCEWPQVTSYLYFALNGEKRGVKNGSQADVLKLGSLKIYMKPPTDNVITMTSEQVMAWFFTHSKSSSLFIIDLSSNWDDEAVGTVLEWADEIWFVIDSDLPRLAKRLLTVPCPEVWRNDPGKIRIIANRWNPSLAKVHVKKQIEATISMWAQGEAKRKIEHTIPVIDPDKVSQAMLAGKLFTECFPEENKQFEQLTFF